MPDYYVSNGFVINKESKDGDRSSEIDGQAAMRITSKYSELEADEFSEKALEESGIADSLDCAEAGLEDSLRFDDETGIDISVSDDIEKGPARIRQY